MPWWKGSQHIEIFSLWLETPQNPSQPWLPRPLPELLTSPGHSHFRFDACSHRGIQEPAPGHGCHPFWRVRAMPHHRWIFLISPWERYIFHFFLLTNWVPIAFEGAQKSSEWSPSSPSSPLGYLTRVLANPRTLSWEPSLISWLPLLCHACSAPVILQPHGPGNCWLSMALLRASDLPISASLGKSSGF